MTARGSMLAIAREVINGRAVHDGHPPFGYDGTGDEEGYITSIVNALLHWCTEYSIDWNAELARAQELFEEDRREDERGEGNPEEEQPACAKSVTKEAADRIFDIVCESDWPEQPDAWPEDAILRALEELRKQGNLQAPTDTSVSAQDLFEEDKREDEDGEVREDAHQPENYR